MVEPQKMNILLYYHKHYITSSNPYQHNEVHSKYNQRHQITSQLVNLAPQRIVIEDLNVEGMKGDRHCAKDVGDAGFSLFRRVLEYKCHDAGIELIAAYRFYPSSKTCCKCGFIHKELKRKDYIYICPQCGNVIDRDYNAAINLMNYNNSSK